MKFSKLIGITEEFIGKDQKVEEAKKVFEKTEVNARLCWGLQPLNQYYYYELFTDIYVFENWPFVCLIISDCVTVKHI